MVDITVRGAGIFGLSIAWTCLRRGASVQVIDPHGPGTGSSGGLLGALAPHVPENWNAKKAFQLSSLLMADAFWAEVESASGISPGYRRSGRLQPVADAAGLDLARDRAIKSRQLWENRAEWKVRRVETCAWSPISPSGWVIQDTLSAHVHPRRACSALAGALAAAGVEIRAEGPDEGAVVWATGVAGLAALGAERGRTVGAGVKGQAALLRHDADGKPQIFVDGLHIVPHLDGTVAVGSTSERDFSDPTSTDRLLEPLIEKARAAVPALADAEVMETWAGVRPRSRSRAPMLGPWPGRPGHFIANGGFKIGFGMAPKVAAVMADLMVDGRCSIPAEFQVAASL